MGDPKINSKLIKTKVERDLGILISNDLKWIANTNEAAAKANSVIGQLKKQSFTGIDSR